MTYRPKPARQLVADPATLYREPSEDRALLSANDWYGVGYLFAIGVAVACDDQHVNWYCGRQGSFDQFNMGVRCARQELPT